MTDSGTARRYIVVVKLRSHSYDRRKQRNHFITIDLDLDEVTKATQSEPALPKWSGGDYEQFVGNPILGWAADSVTIELADEDWMQPWNDRDPVRES